jgi:hypothetical protein
MRASVSNIPESVEKVGMGWVRSSVHGDAMPLKKKVEVAGSGEVGDAAGIPLRVHCRLLFSRYAAPAEHSIGICCGARQFLP